MKRYHPWAVCLLGVSLMTPTMFAETHGESAPPLTNATRRVISRTAASRNQAEFIEQKRRMTAATKESWAKRPFVKVEDASFAARLDEVLADKSLAADLTPPQRQGLMKEMSAFFRAYNAPSYDSYLGFKTNGRPYSFSKESMAKQAKYYEKKGMPLPESDDARARKLWELTCQSTNQPAPKLTQVNLEGITLSQGRTNLAQIGISKIALNTLNAVMAQPGGLIDYTESPDVVLKRQNAMSYVVLGMVCRVDSSELPTIIHISLYWSDKAERWYPWEMVYDANSRYRAMF